MARRLPLEAIVFTVSHPIYAPGRQQYNRYQEIEIPISKIINFTLKVSYFRNGAVN